MTTDEAHQHTPRPVARIARWCSWPRRIGRSHVFLPRRTVACLLVTVIFGVCAFEYEVVKVRQTVVEDCSSGFGIELILADPADPNPWGHESWLRWLRRCWQQQCVNLRPVRSLRIDGLEHPVKQLTPLIVLPELRELDINWTAVTDLSPLKHCRNLTKLECAHTDVPAFACLRKLRNLQQLNLADTAIADLTPLNSLHELRTLNLDATKVTSVSPLTALGQLEDLSLDEVSGLEWQSLGQLTNLRKLSLAKTQITDLSCLKGLKQLQSLNLRNTPVTDLSMLEDASEIEVLDVRGIKVKDFSLFRRMAALRELHVDIPADSGLPLAELAAIKQLRFLDLGAAAPFDWKALGPMTGLRG